MSQQDVLFPTALVGEPLMNRTPQIQLIICLLYHPSICTPRKPCSIHYLPSHAVSPPVVSIQNGHKAFSEGRDATMATWVVNSMFWFII